VGQLNIQLYLPIYVAQSLVFCVVLYTSFFPFSFGHNIVCPSMICMVYVAQSLVFRVVTDRYFN
jgi:hypothetical protein